MHRYVREIRENSFIIYLFGIVALSGLFYVINTIQHGETIQSVYCFVSVNGGVPDALTDHFSTIKEQFGNPYLDSGSIYPPIANLFYKFWAAMIPESLRQMEGRFYVHYCIGFILFYLVCVYGVACCIRSKVKGRKSQNLAVAAFIMSAPLMFTIERGNISLLAVLPAFIFVYTDNSDNKIAREVGLICLALAFSIKIYPAIYGVLLLRKKEWGAASRCGLYGVMLITVPFFAFGGVPTFRVWVRNLRTMAGGVDAWGYGYDVSLYCIRRVIERLLGIIISDRVFLVVLCILCVVLLLVALFSYSRWHALLAATLMLVLIPNASYYYTVLFMWIPMAEMFSEKANENRFTDNKLLIPLLMAGLMIPWALPRISIFEGANFVMSYSYLIYDMCLILIVLAVCWDEFYIFSKTVYHKRSDDME